MKENYVKEEKGVYRCVDMSEGTHIVIPISTFRNLMRIHKQKSCQERKLSSKAHSGYVIANVQMINEKHTQLRRPNKKYGTWDLSKSRELRDNEKFQFLMERKATPKDVKVQCYKIDLQTPYDRTLKLEELMYTIIPEIYDILNMMGYDNDEWPELNKNNDFYAEWELMNEIYVLKKTVYRIIFYQNMNDRAKRWWMQVYATAVPNIPWNMQPA